MAENLPEGEVTTAVKKKALEVFKIIDYKKSGSIDKEEALKFWKKNFAAVNTHEMFKAVDTDHNGKIFEAEWLAFWSKVEHTGHPEEEILDELEHLKQGDSWVSFASVPVEEHDDPQVIN